MSKKQKQRIRAIEHRIENIDIEFTQRGQKRRLLRLQRYRKPLTIKDIDLSKNPDKITFAALINKFGDRMEIFAYKNNDKNGWIALNGEIFGVEIWEWRKIQSGITKLGNYLGVLGR
jgi:hypothetical protein